MNDELFKETYEKYRNTVYTVIFNYVRNHEDASDLAQEAFIKLYTYREELSGDEHIKAWLIRVSINLCKNHLRSRKRFSDEPIPENIPDTSSDKHDDLLPIVLDLPEKYRIPIHLFYYEDLTVTQIADHLGLPEATVKTRLKRGRDKLRKILRKEDWSI